MAPLKWFECTAPTDVERPDPDPSSQLRKPWRGITVLLVRTAGELLMGNIGTAKLSSKGQIVIPEEVRKELGLEPGAQFVVMGEGDVVILKKIEAPDRREFLALARKVRSQARKAGAKRSDIKKAVRASRRRG